MDIQGSRILILGGSGLVGLAAARELLPHRPATLVIAALGEREAREGADSLRGAAGGTEILAEWGNLFVPTALKDAPRDALVNDAEARGAVLDGLYGPLGGEAVALEETVWLALHKPKGYVTTRQDTYGRRTIYDLLPEKYHSLFHVGRLDRDSEGLLLLTNDGDTANVLLHPSSGTTKEYLVDVEGKLTNEEMDRLTRGVQL